MFLPSFALSLHKEKNSLTHFTHYFTSQMKHNSILYLIATAILYICLSMAISCSGNKGNGKSAEGLFVDSVITAEYDSLFIDPAKSVAKLSEIQKSITDSTSYYRINLYIAIGDMINGDTQKTDSLRREVRAYLMRTEHDKYTDQLESLYWNHVAVFLMNSDKDSAIACFQHAYDASVIGDNMAGIIPICINLADVYRQMGDAPKATSYYRRALAVSDSLNENKERLSIYTGLGQVYTEIANYDEADRFFKKAEAIVEGDSAVKVNYDNFFFYVSYGNCLYFKKKYDDALRVCRKADNMAMNFNSAEMSFITQANLGENFLMKRQIDSASHYLLNAQKLFATLPLDPARRFYVNSLLGDLYLHRGDPAKAREYLKKASSDSASAGPRYRALHYARIQEYFNTVHDYQNAYHCMKMAQFFRDSINNEAVRNQMAEIDYRYMQDTTRLSASLIISQKDDKMKRLQIQVYILVIIALAIAVIAAFWIMYKRRKRLASEMKLQSLLYSQRLANMRNRISPHFVFNVLNRELAANNPGINNLVKLLRMNLEMCDRYVVPLSDEIAFVDTYIEDERPSLGEDLFCYQKEIQEGLDISKYEIPSMFVHIFVENAVKHGLRGYMHKKYLRISVKKMDASLVITVENNGNITSSINKNDKTGTGMRIVTQTIQILNDLNKRRIGLSINNKTNEEAAEAVWTVTLTIPDGYNFFPFSHPKR